MAKILIIDDDVTFCNTMESLISRMGLECVCAHTIEKGLKILDNSDIDLVLLDVRLPDGHGLDFLTQIREESLSSPEIIIVTGKGDPDGAELAIQGGVWDYIVKPSPVKQTRLSLGRALKYREEKKNRQAAHPLNLEKIIGSSPVMKSCYELLSRAVVSNAPVLISGETGTGKELFAKTIHENSPRSGEGFIVVDCASLTESLLESTLFGHKKGAFSGAESDRKGLVKLADKGTLFLDEVGDMPLSTQKSFLRVLQEKKFRPVGETKETESDFRLIAATHRDLETMVKKGEFRRDLLFRLCALRLKIPALRHRKEDLKALTMFYVNKLCEDYAMPNKGFEPDFFDVLKAHNWPGNIRELFNVLENAFVASGSEKTLYAMHLSRDLRIRAARAFFNQASEPPDKNTGKIEKTDFSKKDKETFYVEAEKEKGILAETCINPSEIFPETMPSLKKFKVQMEEYYLKELIRKNRGDVSSIIKTAGVSRSHFYGLLKKYGIPLLTGSS